MYIRSTCRQQLHMSDAAIMQPGVDFAAGWVLAEGRTTDTGPHVALDVQFQLNVHAVTRQRAGRLALRESWAANRRTTRPSAAIAAASSKIRELECTSLMRCLRLTEASGQTPRATSRQQPTSWFWFVKQGIRLWKAECRRIGSPSRRLQLSMHSARRNGSPNASAQMITGSLPPHSWQRHLYIRAPWCIVKTWHGVNTLERRSEGNVGRRHGASKHCDVQAACLHLLPTSWKV